MNIIELQEKTRALWREWAKIPISNRDLIGISFENFLALKITQLEERIEDIELQHIADRARNE